MIERNQTIDILRCIGLLLVIAAHCSFNSTFFELREFDVVLLVFCSGASFMLSNKNENYISYVIKRFKRIVLPVWLFLIIFLPFHFYFGDTSFSLSFVLKTFLLTTGGLMFVWVFRIFFTTALCNPILKKIGDKVPHILLLGLLVVCINDALLIVSRKYLTGGVLTLFEYIISYTISYAMISLYGMYGFFLEKKKKWIVVLISLAIYLILGYTNSFSSLYDAKYPPTLYYISYGIFWSSLLSILFDRVHLENKFGDKISWISKYSMTIYMWHIVVYYALADGLISLGNNAVITYIFIIVCSIVCTLISNKIKVTWSKK